ncbi:extracellular solute-binding protein [Natrialbaceae archaeon A-CW3]
MQRRRVLRYLATTGAVGTIAGCTEDSDSARPASSDDGSVDDTADDDPIDDTTDDREGDSEPEADTERITVGPDGSHTFEPDRLEVEQGTTISFVWESPGHNVVPVDQPDGGGWGGYRDVIDPPHEYEFTFEQGGIYEYVCEPHEGDGMGGIIGVDVSVDHAGSDDDQSVDEGDQNTDGEGDSDEQDTDDAEEADSGVDVWHSSLQHESDTFESHVDRFNTDYDAEVRATEKRDLEEQTTDAIPEGDGPELFSWFHDWTYAYYKRGFLSDQRNSLDVDLEDAFVPAAVEAATHKGAVIALPHEAETVGLLYNEDYVDEPPRTFEEMRAIMAEHHDPASGTYGLSFPLDPYFYSAWTHAFGGYYFDEATEQLGLTESETIAGFEFVAEELYPYMPDDPGYEAQASVFEAGDAPFAINGPWFVNGLGSSVDCDVTSFPTVDGHTPTPYVGVGLLYFTSELATEATENEVARSFAEWYTTDFDVAHSRARDHGRVPVQRAMVDGQGGGLPADVHGFASVVAQGTAMPTHPKMEAIWRPVDEAFKQVLRDEATIDEAMAQAESEIRSQW